MITLFSTLKPKYDHRQHNAVKSWVSLPRCWVLLIGEESRPAADEFATSLITSVQRTDLGMPQLDSLFETAQDWGGPGDLFLYVNADIILWDDIVFALEACARRFEEFLMVGQRTNLTLPGPIDREKYRLRWRAAEAIRRGELAHPCGCDYFGFTRDLWKEIPPYAIGRTTWDNWLIWSALEAGKPVIDVTEAVPVVPQRQVQPNLVRMGPDAKINRELVLELGKGWLGWVSHSTYVMDQEMQIREREEC